LFLDDDDDIVVSDVNHGVADYDECDSGDDDVVSLVVVVVVITCTMYFTSF